MLLVSGFGDLFLEVIKKSKWICEVVVELLCGGERRYP
jgi:hypothetical protein